MSSKKFELILVRHGQTTHNKTHTIQGQLDTKLTEMGRHQARLLRDYIIKQNEKFDKVYASDLSRAYETCQIICEDKYDIKKDQLLRERSFGVLQDTPLDNLREEAYKAGYDKSNFTQFCPEGGESLEEVIARIRKFSKDELYPNANDGDRILIVTHGGVIREFFKYFKEIGCRDLGDMIISPNTGVNRFEINMIEGKQQPMVSVKGLHETHHLSDQAKDEALKEEQLNENKVEKVERYAI